MKKVTKAEVDKARAIYAKASKRDTIESAKTLAIGLKAADEAWRKYNELKEAFENGIEKDIDAAYELLLTSLRAADDAAVAVEAADAAYEDAKAASDFADAAWDKYNKMKQDYMATKRRP